VDVIGGQISEALKVVAFQHVQDLGDRRAARGGRRHRDDGVIAVLKADGSRQTAWYWSRSSRAMIPLPRRISASIKSAYARDRTHPVHPQQCVATSERDPR
jgi:hypothetical protein